MEKNNYIDINTFEYKKMVFLDNALNNGWSISKNEDYYVFKKKHQNKREVFTDTYLQEFICKNLTLH
tara:strand:+ start:391 stop:591 length:201 start_codon:yes stop_codon:yes gene_type:complete